MTKQEFIAEFVLRAMTQIQVLEASDEAWYLRVSVRLAHEAWNAMDDYEQKLVGISRELVALAKKALLRLESGKYISQDNDGDWVVFETEPKLHPAGEMWQCGDGKGQYMRFSRGLPPSDFTKQCCRISDLLGTK